MIAAAGAGKTTSLVEFALSLHAKKILITTYTDNNASEISKRIIALNRCVPSNIVVMPWFSFLLQDWVRPFQGAIYEKRINGMQLANGQSAKYVKADDIEKFYFTKDKKIYSDKIAKFGKLCNNKTQGAVIERLTAIYDYILVDELQDITGEDLDVLSIIMQSPINTLFVGDPRQSTLNTNSSRKNKQFKKQNHLAYFDSFRKNGLCVIDGTSMNTSYRCNDAICSLANKLYPKMLQVKSGNMDHVPFEGLFLVRPKDAESFINETGAIQLHDSIKETSVLREYPIMNFGQSKGLTMESVLIYPTKPMKNWFEGKDLLSDTGRCRLYIGITRAKYCVGVIYDYQDDTNIEGFCKYQQ